MASPQTLDEIRRRISIVSLVGERVPLKKSGGNFKGLCPFHQEKTPSFMVSDEKQIFHCFGCAAGGDIFSFLMKLDGLSFPEALEELAKRAGVQLPREKTPGGRDADAEWARRKQWAFRLNEIAGDFFAKNLRESGAGGKALQYLKERGIKTETISKYQLGFADKNWEGLAAHLKKVNAPLSLAAELGLIKKRGSGSAGEGHFDFFRDRIIFPIPDVKEKIIAFGGRACARALDKTDNAKYLNSPDSFLYHKSHTLYGLNWAKDSIRRQDEAILVEGYMDALALWQAGIQNVAAPCGTALTLDHLRLLMRHTKNFVTAFDGDAAGVAAAFRSLPIFLELGLTPKIIPLPQGEDPDSFIQKQGKQAWEKLKTEAPTLFEFFLRQTALAAGPGTAGVLGVWEKIRPLLQKVANPVERAIYLKQTAERLRLPENELQKALSGRGQGGGGGSNSLKKLAIATNAKMTINTPPDWEKSLLAAMVLRPALAFKIRDALEGFENEELKKIGTQLFLRIAEERDESLPSLLGILPEGLANWIRVLGLSGIENEAWEKNVEDCLAKMETKDWAKKMEALNVQIREAEKNGDEKILLKLLKEKKGMTHERTSKRN